VTTLREKTLLAIAEVHSGNGAEGERIADAALSALRQWLADEGLVVVPSEPTVGMFRALTLSQVGDDDQNYRLGCWALGSFASDYAAMIAAAPDALETKP
jgi:hypothetical protein